MGARSGFGYRATDERLNHVPANTRGTHPGGSRFGLQFF